MGKSKAPNMSGVNQAALDNAAISREQLGLAREQMAKDEARQEEYDPIFKKLLESSVQQSDLAAQQSAGQWQSYKDTWQPLEQKLADTAENFDTPERRAAEAATARAGVGIQSAQAREALTRDIGRSGLTLSAGRGLALASGQRMSEAKAAAGADSGARRATEQAGISLVDNAARFGRNMTSTGLESARLSLAGGQAAGGAMGQQQAIASQGAATAGSLFNSAANSNSSAGNLLLGAAQAQSQANSGQMQGLMGLGMMAGNMYAASSKELKEPISESKPDNKLTLGGDTVRKLTRMDDDTWAYTEESGIPDREPHIGPYAEDVQREFGDDVAPQGKAIDMQKMMRINHQALRELAHAVKAINADIKRLEHA